ncbi:MULTISPECIES: hydrogen peroxide-inducible genes activator [Olivibacter]|jgi:LysR family hydrogen peroxide-inducible transcriptional activator|uniref:Transcriptional regulator, LysR family n=3 Tax=Sphingobacteriaceae TaxID=84566 RepID=F4C3B8_SPHS2|nr:MULTISPECIES: hydrogen peroxide-inducible genes activator [Olivibacter]MCL4638764.1 hydrogen peroxide-inducible genes activator [Olivibacter sp. UJ_SKK_5.1]MDM8177024.1 hydrogen peroxide-inducible genes activator [Olivibacter sp. 47]MDX3912391.1 hydrogen peroxide-inducible genes activator [Pseudosphingobacterium sp.]QEL00113.1 hydrogen peroxide-inducible genes activator [Olivibacter sp. LS-1]
MTLVQLEYIIAVDTYRSFVAAADKCFVTQPTLSMQIQKLEESLGVRIFDRTRQPIVPTEIGEEIIRQARVAVLESQKIKEIVAYKKGEVEGELKIGVIPTVAPYLLPKVLGNFMEKYPKLHLHVWEYTTEKIVRELKTGVLDCGILSTPIHEPNLQEHPLFYETFVAYIAKESSLSKKKAVTASDILNEKLWLLNEGHCMRNQVLNICNRRKTMNPDDSFEYNTGSVETLKRMVDTNAGVTIMPELSIAEFSVKELDQVRYFKSPEPVREISLITQQNYLKKRAIEALKSEILQILPKRFRNKKKKEVMDIG